MSCRSNLIKSVMDGSATIKLKTAVIKSIIGTLDLILIHQIK